MSDPDITIEHALTDELRGWLTAELRFPVLAVLDRNGRPTQSVMWFDLDQDQPDTVLLNSMARRAKVAWLRRDPRVSLCFEDGYEWVALRGTAEIDDDAERSLAVIKGLARRYGADPEHFNDEPRTTIRLRVEKVIRY
ncbi:MAG: TIGR03618 family F420-dependent PPOX class oxidoreductase [Chloroflexota bacterium]